MKFLHGFFAQEPARLWAFYVLRETHKGKTEHAARTIFTKTNETHLGTVNADSDKRHQKGEPNAE